jgi:uncharacterized protein
MTATNDPRTVVAEYVAALQGGDEAAVRAAFAPDASWTLAAGGMPLSGTWRGRDNIMDGFFATAMSHYEPGSVDIEITALIAEADRVVLEWTSRARMRDGRAYENGCIGVFEIRDGKIQAVREYMDTLYASCAFTSATSTSATGAGRR